MPIPYTTNPHRGLVTTRTYDIKEGDAPDTTFTDAGGTRQLVIRSRKLTLRTYGTASETKVDAALVEGRTVRKSDGGLGPSRERGLYAKDWNGRRDDLPAWIAEIVTAEGLVY